MIQKSTKDDRAIFHRACERLISAATVRRVEDMSEFKAAVERGDQMEQARLVMRAILAKPIHIGLS